MSGVNKVILIGRLGRNPEDNVLPSGDPVSNFSMAVSKKWKDKQGNPCEKTQWINVVAYKNLADICNKYLEKGSQVYIEGELEIRGYESPKDPDGSPQRYATKVIASKMQIFGSKGDNNDENSDVTERPASASAKNYRAVKNGSSGMDRMESLHGDKIKDDEDIPF